VLVAVGVVLVAIAATVPFLGGTFMPDFREGHFVVQATSSVPGTSLEEMLRFGRQISREILALPYVQSVEQQVGRAELGEDTWGPDQSELHVELKPDAQVDQQVAQEVLRKILEGYPGIQGGVVTFLGDQISESLSGETAQVAIKVFGTDLGAVDTVADRIVTTLNGERGITDLQYKRQDNTPALSIEPEAARLAAAGLKTRDVLEAVESAYSGAIVGQTFSGVRTVAAVVRLPDELRNRPDQLGKLLVAGAYGPVPLSQVARLSLSEDRYNIEHDGGQRRVSVTFNVSGRSLNDAVDEARQRIAHSVALPTGTFLEFTGAAEAERQTRLEWSSMRARPRDMAAVIRGANERLTPILMTATVTALGLAPLAVGLHSPGQEIEAPMAITVLSGLVSSTLLNLLVLPALAHRHSGPREPVAVTES
jgi:Cu/Ag efflux pump CusA